MNLEDIEKRIKEDKSYKEMVYKYVKSPIIKKVPYGKWKVWCYLYAVYKYIILLTMIATASIISNYIRGENVSLVVITISFTSVYLMVEIANRLIKDVNLFNNMFTRIDRELLRRGYKAFEDCVRSHDGIDSDDIIKYIREKFIYFIDL